MFFSEGRKTPSHRSISNYSLGNTLILRGKTPTCGRTRFPPKIRGAAGYFINVAAVRSHMRSLLHLFPLWLFLASVGALAQPAADPPSTIVPKGQLPNTEFGTTSEEEIRTKSAYWHNECMADWDRQSHMTKKQWADTCQRLVADRVKWLRSRDHL